jgi:hypothetical protein
VVNPDEDPAQAKALFEKRLTPSSILTGSFEGIGIGTYQALNLPLTNSSGGSLNASLSVIQPPPDPTEMDPPIPLEGSISDNLENGRFNTSTGGSKWWETTNSFTVDFGNTRISAFGFFGTDFGDFDGNFSLTLLGGANGDLTLTLREATGVTGADAVDNNNDADDGWLQFFGFVDTVNSYSGLRFDIEQTDTNPGNWDFLGFDDFIVGSVRAPDPDPNPNPVPEPTSLALVGLSLLALSATRRRRRG